MGLGVKVKILYIYIIRMSPPTPNCGFRSVDFSGNDPSGNSSADLVYVFPVTEYRYYNQQGNDGNISGTIDLSYNYNSTTNYAVFTNIYYGYSGSSGTYDDNASSGAMKTIVIYNKTSTSFQYAFSKTTGNNTNIYIVFMVVYNNNLDYPASN